MSLSSQPPEEPSPEDQISQKSPLNRELPEDVELLKAVLPPLLDDFYNWFGRTIELIKTKDIQFLSPEQQQDLLSRVEAAQQQVSASKVLSSATNSQAVIEMPVVMAWHKLMYECWGVAMRYRKEQTDKPD